MTGLPLLPLPASVTETDAGAFRLTPDTRVAGDAEAAAVLTAAFETQTGIRLDAASGTGSADGTGTETADGTGPEAADGTETAGGSGPATIELRITTGAPESYRLRVTAASVLIEGADDAGLFYGVQTLVQLLADDADGWHLPAVEIDDAPRFAYRGVMLDVARHFHGVATVQAYIDRASALKFNHLHLHLSDDQGWRLEILSRPELTEKASATAIGGDPGGFYTQQEFREIVAYAARRHMTVVPEIDLPGHTHAVSLAYPELSEQPVLSDLIHETIETFGGGIPVNGEPYQGLAVGFSSLKIRDEATYDLLGDVFREIADLTPGPFVHIGGDEALGTDPADYAYAIERATAIVADLGKTPIAWHEAGAATGIAPGTVGQYWGFVTPTEGMDDKTRGFVRAGGRVILSPADAIYLDMKFSADSPLGLTWANGVTSVRDAYDWEPTAVIDGIGEADILGVEAPMWAETVRSLADIDALAYPRIAAAAEIAWSPASDRTFDSYLARVALSEPAWARMGIGFTPIADLEETA